MEEILSNIENSKNESYINHIIKTSDLKKYNTYDDVDYFLKIANFLQRNFFYKAYYYLLKYGSSKFILAYSNNSERTPSKLLTLKKLNTKYTNKAYKIIENNIDSSKYEDIMKIMSKFDKLGFVEVIDKKVDHDLEYEKNKIKYEQQEIKRLKYDLLDFIVNKEYDEKKRDENTSPKKNMLYNDKLYTRLRNQTMKKLNSINSLKELTKLKRELDEVE